MHLLIPFAYSHSEGCDTALRSLKLPHLEKLLSRLTAAPPDLGNELSLSTPHERVLARLLGLSVADGLIPWAALQAGATAGIWGFITPCHWRASAKQVAMSSLTLVDFPAHESQSLLSAMQTYFEEDGITLQYHKPDCWLARGNLLEGLATASLDRVSGRNLANWMPRGRNAVTLQRLQSEMQMLLHDHPVNDARSLRGAPPINSFWLSGTGSAAPALTKAAVATRPLEADGLRDAALQEDWSAWAQAWQTLDTTRCASLLDALDRGGRVELTLCGERNAQTFHAAPGGLLKRLQHLFKNRPVSSVLQQL